ncbi:RNA polymerase sigma-70 factor [Stenotrophomonas maltophilia]|uniref:RNA polymerase sigma-70 factor n=1 Tax=Stenotrophomonas maltophilia TaxID=40324 RepID=UPI0012B0CF73|nr:RNA polymerase sigma-70 factor [Stenotrophomonas maltophilia]QGM05634.1 RNA polymerase sigma-70 factor [Stenotrophomonas maltophilia]
MEDPTALFMHLRPRLLGIAYRMLGSAAEAEDVVQEVWLRWHGADRGQIACPEAWLVTTTVRRAVDELRLVRHAREHYVGMWLPEPILTEGPATPEAVLEIASDLSVAFLSVLERLAPDARAAFLLHDIFDQDYAQVAVTLEKSEAACRQIIHRARQQLRLERRRYRVPEDVHRRLMQQFAEAAISGDLEQMKALMDDSAILLGDGGGVVPSFPRPLVGGDRIARLFYAPHLRDAHRMRIEPRFFNGRLGLLRYFDGLLESAMAFDTDGSRIVEVLVQRNPAKLARIMDNAIARIR